MPVVRLVAVVFAAALLCGGSCRPVYSERPVGDTAVNLSRLPVAWNGVWCTPLWGMTPALPLSAQIEEKLPHCWSVTVADEANGVLTLKPLFGKDGPTDAVSVYVRWADPLRGAAPVELTVGQFADSFLFLSEEDAKLAGTYLWALARINAHDRLLIWMTNENKQAFVDLAASGELPGQTLELTRGGQSGVINVETDQTFILGRLTDAHLHLMVSRRAQLFNFVPWVIQRVPPTESLPYQESQVLEPSDVRRVE